MSWVTRRRGTGRIAYAREAGNLKNLATLVVRLGGLEISPGVGRPRRRRREKKLFYL
jgi:hypothetical protein